MLDSQKRKLSVRKSSWAIAGAVLLVTAIIQNIPIRADDSPSGSLTEDIVLRDPDIPVLGNPDGDITVVEYFDYGCPPCKTMAPDLARIVRNDGHIRLIFKDWPILGGASVHAAKLVLAAKYQGKFAEAHDARRWTKFSHGITGRPWISNFRVHPHSSSGIIACEGFSMQRI
jgi:protein-disulfide isomerase